jgi:hypothetical protein
MMRFVNALFVLLFAFSVVVQYNDPDPVRWMAIYGAALVACVGWERRWLPGWVPFATAAVAFVWSISSANDTHLAVPIGTALTDWQMHAGGSEELRETLGLLLVVGWMGVIGTWRRREPAT